jgi:hypothetical protein
MKRISRIGARGFSLVELLVAMAVTMVVIGGVLTLFDKSNRMTKTETGVSDAQQSARYGSYLLVRDVRMAGAGGVSSSTALGGFVRQAGVSLTLGSSTWGAALATNNVNASTDTVFISGHHVRAGTDALHIRGVITHSLLDLAAGNWTPPVGAATTGTLVVNPCSKFQDSLATGACGGYGANDMSSFPPPGPFLTNSLFFLTDASGAVGVGRITDGHSVSSGGLVTATLTIDVGSSTTRDSTYAQSLSQTGFFPSGITPSRGGILDDRIYFIDDGTTVAANCSTATSRAVAEQLPGPCHPQLVYADWVYAAGETSAQAFTTATITPVADDIEDLQVAYGVDYYDATANTGSLASPAPARVSNISGIKNLFPSDGSISVTTQSAFNTIVAAARSATAPNQDPSEDASAADKDEWIGNVAGELATGTFNALSDLSRLKALQISILAKGTQPDPTGRSRKSTATVNVAAYPGAFSYPLMDSLARTVSQPTTASSTAYPYRRRATALRIDLRNFQIQ